ncbi:MAG TPA: ATP-binding protein [Candidatus Tumulicola sp.]
MDPIVNPYVPNAGAQPPSLSGRQPLVDAFQTALGRAKAGKSAKSLIPYGLRGVGKTVLLNRFTADAMRLGYEVAFLEADDHDSFLAALTGELRRILFRLDTAERLNEYAKKALRILKAVSATFKLHDISVSLGVDPARGEGDTGNLATDLTSLIVALGEAARAADTAVLIAVDEIQYVSEDEFEALIMALHRATQRSLPILAVATGLPHVLALASKSKTYAERLFDFRSIGALTETETEEAIAKPAAAERVSYEPAALRRLYELTQGYPFYVQEFAYNTWNAAAASPITRADVDGIEKRVIAQLDEGFFRARYDRTSKSERRYMRAMAELGEGPYASNDVARVLGGTQSAFSTTRDSLVRTGMIYAPARGQIAFTVPLFAGFLRRVETL